jgi:hypothetical protein
MMYITEVEEDHHWVMHLAGALNDARSTGLDTAGDIGSRDQRRVGIPLV